MSLSSLVSFGGLIPIGERILGMSGGNVHEETFPQMYLPSFQTLIVILVMNEKLRSC